MANISSLYTGLSALGAHQRSMDIIGHNVSNASTEGYHRQRADLRAIGALTTSSVFAGRGSAYGVEATGVSRSADPLLAARAVRERAGAAGASLTATTLRRIEGLFPEPSDTGLAHQLGEFWSGWSDLSNNPGGLAARTQLLERASTLVTSFHRTAADLRAVRDNAISGLEALVVDANALARQIADLNVTIVANPNAANDLLDQRQLVVAKFAELTGAVARTTDTGQVDIYVGGRSVVSGEHVQPMSVSAPPGGPVTIQLAGLPMVPPAGEAASLLATINDVVPRYQQSLDDMVTQLVADVNAVHQAGVAQDGTTTGLDFFDPGPPAPTAATIQLSASVAGQPANIAAAATAGSPLDGEQARRLAALADSTTGADSIYRSMIGELAVEARAAIRRADIQDQVANSALRDAESVGSVSIDEEMVALIGAQRAYEAAARFMTVVDQMLGVLIERTGVVGR